MDSTRKEIDWTDLRSMSTLADSPAFEEFRKEAEKAISLVCQLSPEEKVEALFLWNRLAAKLREIIEKATDEMMNDIVELTSCRSTSNSPKKKVLKEPRAEFVTPIHRVDFIPKNSSDFNVDGNGTLRQEPLESSDFPETFLPIPIGTLVKSVCTDLEAITETIPLPEDFPNIFSPTSQCSTDLTSTLPIFSNLDTGLIEPLRLDNESSTKDSLKTRSCNMCGQKFDDEKSLAEHVSSSHNFKKPFQCPECKVSFSTRGNLNVHIRKHTGEKPFTCPKCPVRFTSGGNLRRHLLSHQGLKPYQCSMCESRFTEKKSLLIHQRSHSGAKPYVCPICQKGFVQSAILNSHMTVHSSEKPFLCHQCGKSFKQKQQLAAHETRHRGVKNHTCDHCGASFVAKGDLTRHRKSHSDVKPYQCKECNKSFMRRETLAEHMHRHSGVKPLECPKCDKTFDDRSTYHKHIKQH